MLNKRRQLFEIQDQHWCPSSVRDGVTDYLHFTLKELSVYHPCLPLLQKLSLQAQTRRFIDLCSGAGGPMPSLIESLNRENVEPYTVCLSDLYPNIEGFKYHSKSSPHVSFFDTSVDARKIAPTHMGVRTLFSSFHHFPDQEAREILAHSYQQRQAIGIFEFTQRRWLSFLLCLPAAFLMPLFIPLVRPFRFSRLFFTYLIPLIPLVTLVDISTSILRTRTPDELLELTENLHEKYEWHAGSFNSTLRLGVVYLIGYPKN